MKTINDLISKLGIDKLLHLTIAGWCVSLFQFNVIIMIIVTIIITILSIIKELYLDNKADWADLLYAIIGMVIAWIVYLI